jgi:uncharacterized MAPEG superfamily protein
MTRTLALVVYTAFVTWFALLIASVLRARAWTPEGMKLAFGNREHMPEPTALAGRAERAARNTLENFVLFAALALTAQAAGAPEARTALGAEVFFWARVMYLPVYLAGIVYLRTAVWAAGIAGLGILVAAMF